MLVLGIAALRDDGGGGGAGVLGREARICVSVDGGCPTVPGSEGGGESTAHLKVLPTWFNLVICLRH